MGFRESAVGPLVPEAFESQTVAARLIVMFKLIDPRHPVLGSFGVIAVSALTLIASSLYAGDLSPAFRVLPGDGLSNSVKIGASELVWNSQAKKSRIALTNVTGSPITVAVKTCIAPKEENSAGGLRGLTRGFVGVIFLGASEISAERSVESTHTLQPLEKIVVEQSFQSSAQAGEIITTVTLAPRSLSCMCPAERGTQIRERRQAREDYYQARDEEEARWKEQRGQLIASQAQLRPLSAEYKACLTQYWEALNAHKDRMKSLERESPASPRTED